MKRIILVTLTVLLASALIFGGCGPAEEPTKPTEPTEPTEPTPTKPAKVIEWRFASFVPSVDIYSYPVVDWGNYMTEATDGRFKLYCYFADSLVKSSGLPDAIEAGTCDMAAMSTGGKSERFPFPFPITFMGAPFSNPPHIGKGFLYAYDWVEKNYPDLTVWFYGKTKIMWMNCPGGGRFRSLILSNKPIRTMDDLKGCKLAATAWEDIMAWELLGGVCVPLITADHYMGLQTGVIDALHNEYNQSWLWRTFEVTKYRTENTLSKGAGFPINVNLNSLDSLPADIRAIFDASYDSEEMTVKLCSEWCGWHDAHKEWIEQYYEDHGYPAATHHFVLSDEDSKIWNDMMKPVAQEWIKSAEERGLPGQEYWDAICAYADETREQTERDLAEVLPMYTQKVREEIMAR